MNHSTIIAAHNEWLRDKTKGACADLRVADLPGADLSGTNLRGADLWDANLRDANLWNADLRDANLRGADLLGADLRDADLRDANLAGAILSGANLLGANLSGANLRDADLLGAIGNMREMRSAKFETWSVTIIAGTMQIGCQRHSLDLWRKSDPRWIAALDRNATEWWQKWGDVCLKLAEGM